MIKTLQAGRFIAAMAVVVHHAVIGVSAFGDHPPLVVQRILEYGYLGVDFFFVLSGFIIHYSMTLKSRPGFQFGIDRARRIFVPYYPVGVTLALAYTIFPQLSESGRMWSWISTLTLFPTNLPPALSVAWTLQHELIFYAIYAALFFSRSLVPGLIIWTSAIVVGSIFNLPEFPILQIALAPINVEFIAGVLTASIFMSQQRIGVRWTWALSGILLICFWLLGGDRTLSWLVGLAIAAALPWLCRAELSGAYRIPRGLVFGGAASYAIYLTHNPLLSLILRVPAVTELGWAGTLLSSTLLCVMFGIVYFLCWERPAMKRTATQTARTTAEPA